MSDDIVKISKDRNFDTADKQESLKEIYDKYFNESKTSTLGVFDINNQAHIVSPRECFELMKRVNEKVLKILDLESRKYCIGSQGNNLIVILRSKLKELEGESE